MCEDHKFEWTLDKAVRVPVIVDLEASPMHLLAPDVAPPKRGVYALYWKGKLVYGGSTKGKGITLKRRLAEHYKKISGRRGIDVKDMSCRYLFIDHDWLVRAAEDAVIDHYKPEWNGTGFGRHAPGRGRPGVKASAWETTFPKK